MNGLGDIMTGVQETVSTVLPEVSSAIVETSTTSVTEATDVALATGGEAAELLTDTAIKNGPVTTFRQLENLNLEVSSVEEAFGQLQTQDTKNKIISFPQKEEGKMEEEKEEKASLIEMAPNEEIPLGEYNSENKVESGDESDISDEEKRKKDTIAVLQENPEILNALKDIQFLTNDQKKNVAEKIRKLIQEEKDGKKKGILQLLLAIFMSLIVDIGEETTSSISPSLAA